jgi:hypothetical protein
MALANVAPSPVCKSGDAHAPCRASVEHRSGKALCCNRHFASKETSTDAVTPSPSSDVSEISVSTPVLTPSPPSSISSVGESPVVPGSELPFKEECMRISFTFFRPEAPKELNLDASVRDDVLRGLRCSTHPDVVRHLP